MSMFSFHKGKAVQQWRWCCQSKRTENALQMQQHRSCFILFQSSQLAWVETHTSVEHNRKQVNIPPALTDTDKHKCLWCRNRAMLRITLPLNVNNSQKYCQFHWQCITKSDDCYPFSCQCLDFTDAPDFQFHHTGRP